jgi:hypothetical protein
MKNKKVILRIAVIVFIGFTMIACNKNGSSGVKSLNSPEELKKYLDSQQANISDKPIKVSITINDTMLKSVVDIIDSAGKYVSLNITGNALTNIPDYAFWGSTNLTSVTIPDSVTSIGLLAFVECTKLNSVTFKGTITLSSSDSVSFMGDLQKKYLAEGIGTYTTTAPVDYGSEWTKQ